MATQAKVIIKGENNLTQAVKSASSDLSGLKGGFDKLGSAMKSAFTVTAIIAALKALGDAAKKCIDTWAVQEQAYVSLDAVMNNIGKSTGMTTKQLTDMASSLQTVTKFGDEAIIPAEQILVATGKLNKENLPRAIELSLDMATALGTDAASGAQKLAMALQDPATGLRTLRQANITFSASEKATLNTLLASGKTFDAQSMILDKVANAYGGLAQKVADTPTGKITQINNLIGDVQEGLGEGLVMALEPVFDWLIERLSELCRIINDLNADTKLRADFEQGGASLVGSKYTPETIQSSMAKINDEIKIYEDQLIELLVADQPWFSRNNYRNTKASQDMRTMGETGWMEWDKEPEHAGSQSGYQAYLQWKSLSDSLTQLGSALLISQNYQAQSSVEAFQAQEVQVDDSEEDLVVSTIEDFLKSYGSRSESKGLAELQSALEEATSWQSSATDEQLVWLEEIISSLKTDLEPVAELGSIEDFFKSYGSNSESIGIADIQKAIDEANSWKSSANEEQLVWLDEIIATLQTKLEPIEEVASIEDFLNSYRSNSESIGKADIQSAIDEALSWKDSATDEQSVWLDEIIASLQKELEPIEGLNSIEDFLNSYRANSESIGKADIQNAIDEALSWKNSATEEQSVWLDEIIASLQKELEPIEGLSSIDDFFKSYGSNSESIGKADIQKAIDEALSWKSSATEEQSVWLDEIIASLQKELEPVDELSSISDFFKSYGSNSESIGKAEIQSAIDEALSWKSSATEEESVWLDEIIASLQKELEPIEELSSINDFFKTYGSKSESIGKADIQNAIDEANSWKGSATDEQSIWLDEIIATLESELSPVSDSIVSLEDFLASNKNLSVTSQVEEIQSRIDTALSFDTTNATEEQKQVLDEIILSSKEAIKNLTEKAEEVVFTFVSAIDLVKNSWATVFSSASVDAGLMDDLSASVGKLLESVKPLVQLFFSSNPLLAVLIPIIEGFVDVLAPAMETVISPIMDALRWIGSSLAGVLLPILDAIYPILAIIGGILTTAVAPVLELLNPVIELVALAFSALTPVIAWVGKILTVLISPIQFVADLLSWLGDWLSYMGDCVAVCAWNLTHWFDQRSYRTNPGGFSSDAFTGLEDRMAAWDAYGLSNTAVSDSVSTGTAVSSASYQGATQVTINIYQEAPVVGDGGMREFAQMIRDEFSSLDYYGVSV